MKPTKQPSQPPASAGSTETHDAHRPAAASAVPSQEEWRRVYTVNFQPPWSSSSLSSSSTASPLSLSTATPPSTPPTAVTPSTPLSSSSAAATFSMTKEKGTISSPGFSPQQPPQPPQSSQQRLHRAPSKPIMYMGSRQKQSNQPSTSSSPPPPSSSSSSSLSTQVPVLSPLGSASPGRTTSIASDALPRGSENSSDSTDTFDENETLTKLKEEIRQLKAKCARKDADRMFLQKDLDEARAENKRLAKSRSSAGSTGTGGTLSEENDRLRAELEQMKEKYERSNEYSMLLEKKVFHLTSIKFSLEKAVAKMITQLREQQEGYHTIAAELERKNEQVIQEMRDAHEQALEKVRQEYEAALACMRESFNATSDKLRETSDATVRDIQANQDSAIVAIGKCATGIETHDASIKEYYMNYKEELDPLAEVDTLIARAEKRICRTETEKENPWRAQYKRMCAEGNDPFQVPEEALTKAGPPGMNVSQLVDMAVDSYASDGSFVTHLLMMYRTFTSAQILFKTIAGKYVKLCKDDDGDDGSCLNSLDEKDSNKNSAMRAILDDLIFRWTKLYPNDFIGNDLKSLLMIFVKNFVTSPVYRDSIIKFVLNPVPVPISSFSVPPPTTAQSPSSSGTGDDGQTFDPSRSISSFDPEDIAHQIIFDDNEIFSRITLEDLLDPNKAPLEPNVKALSDRFNWISSWAQTEIVTASPKDRSSCLKRVVRFAKECLDKNDFLATVAVGNVFDTAAIVRLKFVAEIIEKRFTEKDKAAFAEIRNISKMGNNYKNVRQAMSKAAPPVIPFFAVYLRDLVFINDGNPETINGGINFTKKRMFAEKYQEIFGFRSTNLPFSRNVPLANWMASRKVLSSQECFMKSKEAEQHDAK